MNEGEEWWRVATNAKRLLERIQFQNFINEKVLTSLLKQEL